MTRSTERRGGPPTTGTSWTASPTSPLPGPSGSGSPSHRGSAWTTTAPRTGATWRPRSTRWWPPEPTWWCWPSTTSPSAAARRAPPTPGVTTWLRDHLGDRADAGARAHGVRGHHRHALPRGAGRGCARGRPDRLDRTGRCERPHHRRRRPSPGGRPGGTASAAVGQLPRERRRHGRSALPGPAAWSRARPPGCVQRLPGQPDGPATSVAPAAGLGRGLRGRGQDPELAWETAAADLGWLAFARACDSDAAHRAVDQAARRRPGPRPRLLRRRGCVRRPGPRGRGGRLAHPGAARRHAWPCRPSRSSTANGRWAPCSAWQPRWQASRRAKVTVFGPRVSVRPVLGQALDGTWRGGPGRRAARRQRDRRPGAPDPRGGGRRPRARGRPGRTPGCARGDPRASRRRADPDRARRARTARRRSSRGWRWCR